MQIVQDTRSRQNHTELFFIPSVYFEEEKSTDAMIWKVRRFLNRKLKKKLFEFDSKERKERKKKKI